MLSILSRFHVPRFEDTHSQMSKRSIYYIYIFYRCGVYSNSSIRYTALDFDRELSNDSNMMMMIIIIVAFAYLVLIVVIILDVLALPFWLVVFIFVNFFELTEKWSMIEWSQCLTNCSTPLSVKDFNHKIMNIISCVMRQVSLKLRHFLRCFPKEIEKHSADAEHLVVEFFSV